MLDSPARVWQRASEVVINPPFACRPFVEALKARCSTARFGMTGWTVGATDAWLALDLLRTYFPVVEDERADASAAPTFVDGEAGDMFARLDLVPLLLPLGSAFRAIQNDYHDDRAKLTDVAAHAPQVPLALGFGEHLDGRWSSAYAAQRLWQFLLRGFGDAVRGTAQVDGTLVEQIMPDAFRTFWLQARTETCGPLPKIIGQCWYPPQSTLPIWLAAVLACSDGPAFTRNQEAVGLTRILPPWPLRLSDKLYRLDLKDAAHWPVSTCVLPGKQSHDGNDALLHLSTVGGVSKNRALWAAILDGRREQIPLRAGRQRHYPRRVEGRNQYISDWNDEPLPTSGLSHLALTHRSAFEPELGQSFLHLAGNDLSGAPDVHLFAQQLSRAISVPFDLAWGEQLWRYGTDTDDSETSLITPLPSSGCQGYWVLADEARWTRLIIAVQKGIKPRNMSDDDLVITEVGALARLDEIIEQADEGNNEIGDDAE